MTLDLLPYAGLSLVGIVCIFLSWRTKKQSKKRILKPLAWFLLALSTALLVLKLGAEFGFLYGITLPSLIAICLLYLNRDVREAKTSKRQNAVQTPESGINWRTNLGKMFLTLPFAGIVSMTTSTSFAIVLPLNNIDSMLLAVFLSMTLWALFAYWLSASENKKPAVLMFGSGAAISIIHLMF